MSQVYSGIVIKQKTPKTVGVELTFHRRHPKYHKVIKLVKKVQVHNENFVLQLGDKVTIQSCRPYSKTKSFLIIKKGN